MCKLAVYSTQELLTVSGNSLPADVQGNRGLLTPPPGRWYPLLGQFEHVSGFMHITRTQSDLKGGSTDLTPRRILIGGQHRIGAGATSDIYDCLVSVLASRCFYTEVDRKSRECSRACVTQSTALPSFTGFSSCQNDNPINSARRHAARESVLCLRIKTVFAPMRFSFDGLYEAGFIRYCIVDRPE